ncbi:unnamed protein product [Echinostoma caproni]|uniref:Leucine-rich repeat-containing protein 51 n=1 Tax=Echinostoma caproni TaxID=27848 RepID=A0A183AC80_9TREM|nr:unnamed protein product [Echinostoma caproni]
MINAAHCIPHIQFSEPDVRHGFFSRRSTLAPRIRIVDEYFGLGKVERIMACSNTIRKPSVPLRLPGSETVRPAPQSTLYNHRTRSSSSEVSVITPGHLRRRRRLIEQRRLAKQCASSAAALTALKEATKSVLTTPPFPSLELIDLSHNLILYEQHILPVAVWPELRELSIHHNPVVSRHSGTPPLLEQLLVGRLHLNVRRTTNASSWYNDNGQLVAIIERKSETKVSKIEDKNKFLALPGPLINQTGTHGSEARRILSANQLKARQLAGGRRRPLLVPARLSSEQLAVAPKPARCNPDKMLKELREQTTLSARSQQQSTLSSSRSTDLSLLSDQTVSDRSDHVTGESTEKSEQEEAVQRAPTIADQSDDTSSKSKSVSGRNVDEADGTGFFTTQLADYEVSQSIDATDKDASGPLFPVAENQFSVKENLEMDQPISPVPLLPDLEWLVDETNLPDTMQACLRELRHWCQHRPIVHDNTSNTQLLSVNSSPAPPVIDTSSSNRSNCVDSEIKITRTESDKSVSEELSGQMGAGSLESGMKELALMDTLPKLQYTSMLAIHLPKVSAPLNETD